MATKREDLWPVDIATAAIKSPVVILREPAAMFGRRTKNLVEAEVITDTIGESLRHRFILVTPALDNYRFELFSVIHKITFYPLEISSSVSKISNTLRINSEEEFKGVLKELFSSTETKNIIRSLLAQVQT